MYTKQTKEQNVDGSYETITADFRKYACVEDSIADHSAYLLGAMNGSKKRYEGIAGMTDYKKVVQLIKDGGYATFLTYVEKLCSIIEKWNLKQYDVKETATESEKWYRVRKSWAVSHHTAMEYYGITDQVFYDVYVSSETSFRDFTFDGYTYCYVASKSSEGIEKPPYSGGIAVTNLERTIVDSIKDMDKISGMEEVVQNMESVHRMQEKRLLKYLELYQNQFLYQKMGYLLWQHKEQMGLSDSFFEKCKKQIGKSKRYLTRDQDGGCYDDTWKLVVPDDLQTMKNGVMMDADI